MALEDAVEALKWKAFWKHSNKGERLRDHLTAIAELMGLRNKDRVKTICATKSEVTEMPYDLVETFFCKAVNNSEIFNWDAHLMAVLYLLHLFRESDSINYLRCVSLYLEQMGRRNI